MQNDVVVAVYIFTLCVIDHSVFIAWTMPTDPHTNTNDMNTAVLISQEQEILVIDHHVSRYDFDSESAVIASHS